MFWPVAPVQRVGGRPAQRDDSKRIDRRAVSEHDKPGKPLTIAERLFDGVLMRETQVRIEVGDGPRSIAVGDLNGDGSADIVIANSGSDDISVLLGQGDGTF